MRLIISGPEAHRAVRELIALTGESITDAVLASLQERIERERLRRSFGMIRDEMQRIREQYRMVPLPLQEEPSAGEAPGLRADLELLHEGR